MIVLFDFDETLVSSKAAYHRAYLGAIERHLGTAAEDLFHEIWSSPATLPEVLRRQARDRAELVYRSFEEYYHHYQPTLTLYPSIVKMLESLRAGGARLGIVSLKPRRAGERELDLVGLRDYFEVVVWGDDVSRPKPEPDGCLKAIAELKSVGGSAVMCGDSPSDIKMGRAAGITTAAALWGEVHREALVAANPDYVFDCPEKLAETLLQRRNI